MKWKERLEKLRPKVSISQAKDEPMREKLQSILDLYWDDLKPHLEKFIEDLLPPLS